MFWKRKESAVAIPGGDRGLPKVAVCCVDPAESCAAAKRLAALRICEAVPLLTDAAKEVIPICCQAEPDLLVLEAMPNAMEKLDDPDKDIAGRCGLAARVREQLPRCRVYLTCAESFRRLEPVMQKAVETRLIHGYCFGSLSGQQVRAWLSEG